MVFNKNLAMIFTSTATVVGAVNEFAAFLAFTVVLNCIQPVLSGVAVGSGWQSSVAYINIVSYYIIGTPLGFFLAWSLHLGIKGLWAGLLTGTVVQTVILIFITIRCDWEKQLGMASALETLCGQAYGAKRYHMLGIFMQRSWIVQFVTATLLLPLYFFASPILKLLGQPDDVAELSGLLSLWLIPLHFAYAFQFPLVRFLQSQRKAYVSAWVSLLAVTIHIFMSWLFVYKLGVGVIGSAITINISWWIIDLGLFSYVVCGGCPDTWGGFSVEAFSGLWDYFKLSAASGVMLCLEIWYYKILMLMTGYLNNAKIAMSALAVCMNINTWEMMIPLAFFAATGVRVANELGAGNGKAAKFASIVSATTSMIIGLCICTMIMIFHGKLAFLFTLSDVVIQAVDQLTFLLAITILLNSIQPILSGVAVGSGWQASVAYINLGCYYVVGLPLGVTLGWVFRLGVGGIWSGMVGGTAVQTLILIIMTMRCDWDMQAEKASLRMRMLATPSSKA